MTNTHQRLLDFCENQTIINTHCHHLPDSAHKDIGLDDVLQNTYVSWCGVPFGDTAESRKNYVRRLKSNTYFYWVEKALQRLCGIDEELTEQTWDVFDAAVRRQAADGGYHLHVLKERCGYDKVILDAYWNPGSNEGHPEIFAPTYRINMFLFGYSRQARDHNGNNPFEVCGWKDELSFDAYLSRVKQQIARQKEQGCVALKSAIAYDRGLDFASADRRQASNAYMNPCATEVEIKAFQDCVFHHICQTAAELSLPIQVHTGLGKMHRSNAMQLQSVIESHPDTQFVLFHGSYPWTQDVLGLVHVYQNVFADLCWLPLISTTACERFLRELIEVGDMDRVMWGCDTWTSVESFGAVLAVRSVLAKVFADCVDDSVMSIKTAEAYITHILYQNAKTLYRM